jgi:hypothetical protein
MVMQRPSAVCANAVFAEFETRNGVSSHFQG